jgi:acetyltransferase-like isoleucine patch superfamily enzyme
MKKLKLIIMTIFLFPIRLFSKISPLTLIRDSKLSKKCAILSNTRFYHSSIGDYSYLGRNCFVYNTEIGKFCSIADNCNIGLALHPTTWVSTSPVFQEGKNILKANFSDIKFDAWKKTIIENDVWIGIGACIMSGVRIGTGAVIGAGAIVTKDVEAYAVMAGNPAKLMRKRFDDEIINKLLEIKWWDWNESVLLEKAKYFSAPEGFLNMEED